MPRSLLCVVCLGTDNGGRTKFCACFGPWYCSKECQAAHWPEHRRFCEARRFRVAIEVLAGVLVAVPAGLRPLTAADIGRVVVYAFPRIALREGAAVIRAAGAPFPLPNLLSQPSILSLTGLDEVGVVGEVPNDPEDEPLNETQN